jgi:hypothetical protein
MAAKAASPPEGFDIAVLANCLVGTEEIELVARHPVIEGVSKPSQERKFSMKRLSHETGPFAAAQRSVRNCTERHIPYEGSAAPCKILLQRPATDADSAAAIHGPGQRAEQAAFAGAGAEFDLGKNWSAKAEYDYMQFGTHTALATDGTTFMTDKSWVSQLKVGVNYRFTPGGVVANY